MYCSNCGNQIEDHNVYCACCGAFISSNNGQFRSKDSFAERREIRSENIEELGRCINYFSEQRSLYDEYDGALKGIDPAARKTHVVLIVFGIILFNSSMFSMFASKFKFDSSMIPGLITLGGALALILAYVLTTVARNNNYKKSLSRISELTNELLRYYNQYAGCMVGFEYTNPYTLGRIYSVMTSMQADTIKEAVSILETNAASSKRREIKKLDETLACARANGAIIPVIIKPKGLL